MQQILDLEHVEERQVHPAPAQTDLPIPAAVRRAGYLVDVESLQPGDLILTSARSKFKLVPSGISFAHQLGGYAWDHARWTHAAVYVGDFLVCEATGEGVRLGSVTQLTAEYNLRVRRGCHQGAMIDRETGWRIALYSLMRLNQRYDSGLIGKLFGMAVKGYDEYRPQPPKQPTETVICSELFQDAYCRATHVQLQNPMSREVTPAFLSATPLLEDVPCRWRKLRC